MIYPYGCTYKKNHKFLAWEDRNVGGDVFRKEINTGGLFICESITELKQKLGAECESNFSDEISEMDFDKFWICVKNLKSNKSSSTKTCNTLLNGWNFIEDLIRTVGQKSDLLKLRNPVLDKIYDKVFYGNNLPSITPEGKIYHPVWTRKEISTFRRAIKSVWHEFFPKSNFL
jgi:hypothetical protein